MLILTQATIDAKDPGADIAFNGLEGNGEFRITHDGDCLTVTLKDERGRFSRVDRLTRATRVDPKGKTGGTWAFSGVSDKLIHEARLSPEEAAISFTAKGKDGCPTCH